MKDHEEMFRVQASAMEPDPTIHFVNTPYLMYATVSISGSHMDT